MSCFDNVEKAIIEQKDLYDITTLYQFKGKDFYYNELFKKEIKTWINDAISKECKAVLEIFGAEVNSNRFKNIVKNDSEPKTGDERFLKNVKSIFTSFSENVDMFDKTISQLESLVEKLFYNLGKIKLKKYPNQVSYNLVVLDDNKTRRRELEDSIVKYNVMVRDKKAEHILLMSCLYVDFVNMAPFEKYNDIIGLIWLYSMLYSEGFYMFKFVSFFEIYNLYKDEFVDAVNKSSVNWAKGYADASPLAAVIRKMMIDGYQKVDSLLRAKEIHSTNKKSDKIEYTILKSLPEVFTKEMVREINPDVSAKTIERTLVRLQEENKIRSLGGGRTAKWIKIEKIDEFNVNDLRQASLFDFLTDEEEAKRGRK